MNNVRAAPAGPLCRERPPWRSERRQLARNTASRNATQHVPYSWKYVEIASLVFAPLLCLLLTVSVGCNSSSDQPPETAAEPTEDQNVARSEVERGPVKVTVEVEPREARLSDEPTLTLTIDYEQGVTVRKPPFGEAMGDFLVRDFHEPLPKLAEGREVIEQIYTLEPTQTGESIVLPIAVTFVDDRPDGDGKEHTIETEGLTVEIASVVGEELPSLDDLRPAAGPVALPEPSSSGPWLAAVLLGVLVAGGVGAWFWWSRRREAPEQQQLTPQQLAYLELERIVEANLAETDVKQYYVELTAVVRRYIERTTGVRAPEQTTEEFLREISGARTFADAEGRRLKAFLESADLVKFAAHQPHKEDVEESFRRAKLFLGLATMEATA